MKITGGIALVSALSLSLALAAGCGKKDEGKAAGDQAGGDKASGDKAGGDKAGASCSEANDVKITWTAEEMYAPGPFEHKHTLGFLSGMAYNGKTVSKIGYVVVANYDVKMGPYMIEIPKEKGHQAVLIKFNTAAVPATMETQKAEYAKLALTKGEQPQAVRNSDAGFSITYFVGGESGGPGITNSESKGTANLTAVDGSLCGSIDFTSPKGSTIKGTFNAKIAKDLWAK